MASNGLVANKTKTEFLVLNEKDKSDGVLNEISVGDQQMKRVESTKMFNGKKLKKTRNSQQNFAAKFCKKHDI